MHMETPMSNQHEQRADGEEQTRTSENNGCTESVVCSGQQSTSYVVQTRAASIGRLVRFGQRTHKWGFPPAQQGLCFAVSARTFTASDVGHRTN